MYLKVYYSPKGGDASIDEVKAALPTDMAELTVDANLGYPCVNFPKESKYADWQCVQKALQAAGFETE